LSDVLREASGLVLVVRVGGTPSFPKFKLAAIPDASEFFRSLGQIGNENRRR
jgi:hypothetical protein